MIEKLTTPKLIVDKVKCETNIIKMVSKIDTRTSTFRPHFKTHNSSMVGEWYKESGISKITVSSLDMALYFAQNAWKDITIALPFNIHWLPIINKHAQDIHFNILVEDSFFLNEIIKTLKYPCGIFIKIDLGYHRTGITPDNYDLIDKMAESLKYSSNAVFKGFLGHAGHTYHCNEIDSIKNIYFSAATVMQTLKSRYKGHFPELISSYGDTPSCSITKTLNHFDEYRPGNFVFYDLMQYNIGSCDFDNIALALACPVLTKHKNRNEIVIHGGAVHLSKEYIVVEGQKNYGQLVFFNADGTWYKPEGKAYVKSLSQEHGLLKADDNIFNQIEIGSTLGIIPVHSCLTAFQMRYMYEVIGNGLNK